MTVAVRMARRCAAWQRDCLRHLQHVADYVVVERADDRATLAADIVVDLTGKIDRTLPAGTRWYFAFGAAADPTMAFSTEIASGGVLDVTLLESGDRGERTLRSGTFGLLATHGRTLKALLDECARWPALEIERLKRSAKGAGESSAFSTPRALSNRRPNALARTGVAFQFARRILERVVARTFVVEEWNVGIVRAAPEDFLNAAFRPQARWLDAPAHESLADPFVLKTEPDCVTLLCERWRSDGGRGRIARVALTPSAALIDEEFREEHHVSYPYVVRENGAVYCIPERHEAGELALYRIDDGWHREGSLLSIAAVDATPVRHEGRWWIFTSDESRLSRANLFAFHADRLAGPWIPHARNPIKTDVRSARSAGMPFIWHGGLIRPAQDCSRTYGGAIVFNRIDRLDLHEFEESTIARFDPRQLDRYRDACHTLSFCADTCAIDGRRDRIDVILPAKRIFRRVVGRAR